MFDVAKTLFLARSIRLGRNSLLF